MIYFPETSRVLQTQALEVHRLVAENKLFIRLWQLARRRNFTILTMRHESPFYYFQNPGGEFNLADWTGPGVTFGEFSEFKFDCPGSKLLYVPELLSTRGGPLSLLHEAGHAQQFQTAPAHEVPHFLGSLPASEDTFMWIVKTEMDAWLRALEMGQVLETYHFNILSEFKEDELIDAMFYAVQTHVFGKLLYLLERERMDPVQVKGLLDRVIMMDLHEILVGYVQAHAVVDVIRV